MAALVTKYTSERDEYLKPILNLLFACLAYMITLVFGFSNILGLIAYGISRASLTVRITVKNGDPSGDGKIWENRFCTGKMGHHGAKCTQIDEGTCQGVICTCQNFFCSLTWPQESLF